MFRRAGSVALLPMVPLLAVAAARAQDDDATLKKALADYPCRLLFESNRDGNWELYVVGANGEDARNLTQTADVDEVYGKVSPDGRWIAFCSDVTKDGVRRRSVWRMKVDGSSREKVADDARDPFWSHDSSMLGFLPAEYPRFDFAAWATRGVRIFTLATGAVRDLPNSDIEHIYTPSFTDDGKWILATVHGGMGYSQAIVLIATAGADVHALGLQGCRPDLAPDGRTLTWGLGDYALGRAELRFDDDEPQIKVTGQIVRNSGRQGQTYHADWSPDGKYVAYSCGPPDRRRGMWSSVLPQCPGVEAKGWDLWIADGGLRNVRVRITTDGMSNKEPDWIPAPAPAHKGEPLR